MSMDTFLGPEHCTILYKLCPAVSAAWKIAQKPLILQAFI